MSRRRTKQRRAARRRNYHIAMRNWLDSIEKMLTLVLCTPNVQWFKLRYRGERR